MAAEEAGIIVAEIRLALDNMEKDGVSAQKMLDELSKKFEKKGKEGGENYVKGFGSAQANMNRRLNNMVSSMEGISPKMGALGAKMAGAFSKPIFSMIPAVTMAFQAMLPIIGTILVAVGALAKGISSVAKAQKEFTDNVKLAKEAQEALTISVAAGTRISEKQNEVNDRKAIALAKLRLAFDNMVEPIRRMGSAVKDLIDKAMLFLIENLEAVARGLGRFLLFLGTFSSGALTAGILLTELSESLRRVSDETAVAAAADQRLVEVHKQMVESAADYERQLRSVQTAYEHGARTAEEADKDRISAMNTYINSLVQAQAETIRLAEEAADPRMRDEIMARYEARKLEIEDIVRQRNELVALYEVQGREKTDQEKITEAREAAIKRYEQAVKMANAAYEAGLISEEEHHRQIQNALAQKYNALESIVQEYNLTTGATVELRNQTAELVKANLDYEQSLSSQLAMNRLMIEQGDTLKQQEIDRYRAAAAVATTEEERIAAINRAIVLENELIQLQRDRAREALMQTDDFINASRETREKILADFDLITEGMKKVEEELISSVDSIKDVAADMISPAVQLVEEIASASTAGLEKELAQQTKLLDEQYNRNKARLEKELQDKLYAMGFITAQTKEQHEKELQMAIESGDQQRIFAAHSASERFKVEEEYAEKQRELEEEHEREKAKLAYRAELAAWNNKKLSLYATIAQAAVQALAHPPGPPTSLGFVTLATATGVAQRVALQQAKPVLSFSRGGIVPGNSYTGDKLTAGVNSKEMWLAMDQQKNLFDRINNNDLGGDTNVTIPIYLDGSPIAKVVVEKINSRQYLIQAGSVV